MTAAGRPGWRLPGRGCAGRAGAGMGQSSIAVLFLSLSGPRSKRSVFCQLAAGRDPLKGKGLVLSSPVASNEASTSLPVGSRAEEL